MDEKRNTLMVHSDVTTVPETISWLYNCYQKSGYKMSKKIMFAFWYYRKDESKMIVYWEDGYIFEEIRINNT